MVCSNRVILVLYFFGLTFFQGCGVTGDLLDWKGDRALDEYGKKLDVAYAELNKYIGRSQVDVKTVFGIPTEIENEIGLKPIPFQEEKIPYDEVWWYIVRRGIPLVYSEGSTKRFFFEKGVVVAVDTF